MNWIDKLERKFGRFGIPNLTVYIIICYVVRYLLYYLAPSVLSVLSLNITAVFHGQIWRLITWVISPPSTGNVFLFILSIVFFYYPLGTALERTWGTFRYTLYIFCGVLLTVLGAIVVHFVMGGAVDAYGMIIYNTYYISLSIFLAFATMAPDQQVLLWFIIPIKMKWMAYVYLAIMAWNIFDNIRYGRWFMTVPIICSLLNFALFYFTTRKPSYNPQRNSYRNNYKKTEPFRNMEPRSRAARGNGTVTKHKCAICGRTELDDPTLEFRFCSRCNGNYEYCQDHLFTHTHVQ